MYIRVLQLVRTYSSSALQRRSNAGIINLQCRYNNSELEFIFNDATLTFIFLWNFTQNSINTTQLLSAFGLFASYFTLLINLQIGEENFKIDSSDGTNTKTYPSPNDLRPTS